VPRARHELRVSKTYQCPLCREIFARTTEANAHLDSHEPPPAAPLPPVIASLTEEELRTFRSMIGSLNGRVARLQSVVWQIEARLKKIDGVPSEKDRMDELNPNMVESR